VGRVDAVQGINMQSGYGACHAIPSADYLDELDPMLSCFACIRTNWVLLQLDLSRALAKF
jgi:hypothetical protein